MNDVVKFDSNAFQKKVAEKVIQTFGELIPEEAFNTMVGAAMKEFFEDAREWRVIVDEKEVPRGLPSGAYGTQNIRQEILSTNFTPFKQMVWSETRDLIKAKLHAHLNAPDSPINTFLQSLFAEGEWKDAQVSKVQDFSVRMASRMIYDAAAAQGMIVRTALANALDMAQIPDIASQVAQGGPWGRFPYPPGVTPGPDHAINPINWPGNG